MKNEICTAGLLCAIFGASGLFIASAHAHPFESAIATPTTSASSGLQVTGGGSSVSFNGGAGAFPSWSGFSDAGQTIGLSKAIASADFSLFMTPTMVITNGFANSSIVSGADIVAGEASASSLIEITFELDDAHHFEIHSVEANQANGSGSVVLAGASGELFRYEGTHVHEIRGDLPPGSYSLKMTAETHAVMGGAASVGLFDLEFEVFEGSLCPADLNEDRLVDDADFVEFAAAYNDLICPVLRGERHEEGCPADFNLDGVVDDADFVVFANAYNELICP
ncbi:MAG: hypothetical protein ACREJD_15030 [Phycisphaerales bacterium]